MTDITQNIYRNIDGRKQRCGMLVACSDGISKVYIGFSLCKKSDKFDKVIAAEIAYGRAEKKDTLLIPASIVKDVDFFISRVARYYKGQELATEILEPSAFKCGRK